MHIALQTCISSLQNKCTCEPLALPMDISLFHSMLVFAFHQITSKNHLFDNACAHEMCLLCFNLMLEQCPTCKILNVTAYQCLLQWRILAVVWTEVFVVHGWVVQHLCRCRLMQVRLLTGEQLVAVMIDWTSDYCVCPSMKSKSWLSHTHMAMNRCHVWINIADVSCSMFQVSDWAERWTVALSLTWLTVQGVS